MYKLIALTALISFPTFSATPVDSELMVNILKENGIVPARKRQDQEATIKCKIPTKTGELSCTIFAGPSGYELNSSYEDLAGAKALELSKLLVQFNVKPTGKKSIQYAQIHCRTSKHNPDGPSLCEQVPHYFMPIN